MSASLDHDGYVQKLSFDDYVGYLIPGLLTTGSILALSDATWSYLRQQVPEWLVGAGILVTGYAIGVLVASLVRPLEQRAYPWLLARWLDKSELEPAELRRRLDEYLQPAPVGFTGSAENSIYLMREVIRSAVPASEAERKRLAALSLVARNLMVPTILGAVALSKQVDATCCEMVAIGTLTAVFLCLLAARWWSLETRALRLTLMAFLLVESKKRSPNQFDEDC